jgi:hypothetical protein
MSNSPTLAPGTFRYDTTVYIVLNDFGKLGNAYAETDEAEADESAVLSDIVSGAHSNPLRVVAFNTHEGWSRNVTEDIAYKILDLNSQGRELSPQAREFVERVTGQSARVTV